MTNAKGESPKPKKTGYINKLQAENKSQAARIKELEAKTEVPVVGRVVPAPKTDMPDGTLPTVSEDVGPPPIQPRDAGMGSPVSDKSLPEGDQGIPGPPLPLDDRDEPVTVSVPLRESTPDGKRVYHKETLPKRAALEFLVEFYANRKNKLVEKPDTYDKTRNNATCYCRIAKREVGTGRRSIAYNDVPLWLAATRILEGKLVELISKAEYERIEAERNSQFEQWRKEIYQRKKMEILERISQM
jgi:hypothetical protein